MVQTANEVTSNRAGFKPKWVANRQGKFWGSSKQGGESKKTTRGGKQNKIPNNIHVAKAKGTCNLPFLDMKIQRTPEPEHSRTETDRKAQTGGGFGKWVKSSELEKEMV